MSRIENISDTGFVDTAPDSIDFERILSELGEGGGVGAIDGSIRPHGMFSGGNPYLNFMSAGSAPSDKSLPTGGGVQEPVELLSNESPSMIDPPLIEKPTSRMRGISYAEAAAGNLGGGNSQEEHVQGQGESSTTAGPLPPGLSTGSISPKLGLPLQLLPRLSPHRASDMEGDLAENLTDRILMHDEATMHRIRYASELSSAMVRGYFAPQSLRMIAEGPGPGPQHPRWMHEQYQQLRFQLVNNGDTIGLESGPEGVGGSRSMGVPPPPQPSDSVSRGTVHIMHDSLQREIHMLKRHVTEEMCLMRAQISDLQGLIKHLAAMMPDLAAKKKLDVLPASAASHVGAPRGAGISPGDQKSGDEESEWSAEGEGDSSGGDDEEDESEEETDPSGGKDRVALTKELLRRMTKKIEEGEKKIREEEILALFKEHGGPGAFDLSAVTTGKNSGRSLLHVACGRQFHSIAQLLIGNGADVNARDSHGRTPLFDAVAFKSSQLVVQSLMKSGGDVNARDNRGITPLLFACQKSYDHNHILSYMWKNGADVNVQSQNGNTPLIAACYNGLEWVAKELVYNDADVNLLNDKKNSALMASIHSNLVDISLAIIEKGCDVNAVNLKGTSVLTQACAHNDNASVALALVDKGAIVGHNEVKALEFMLKTLRMKKPPNEDLVKQCKEVIAAAKSGKKKEPMAPNANLHDAAAYAAAAQASKTVAGPQASPHSNPSSETDVDNKPGPRSTPAATVRPAGLLLSGKERATDLIHRMRKACREIGDDPFFPDAVRDEFLAFIRDEAPLDTEASFAEDMSLPELWRSEHGTTTLLDFAMRNEQMEIAVALIERGANPNRTFPDGKTVLDCAMDCPINEHYYAQVVHALLKHGVHLQVLSPTSRAPLGVALERNAEDVAVALVKHQVPLDPDLDGAHLGTKTFMQMACEMNSTVVVATMLNNNVRVDKADIGAMEDMINRLNGPTKKQQKNNKKQISEAVVANRNKRCLTNFLSASASSLLENAITKPWRGHRVQEIVILNSFFEFRSAYGPFQSTAAKAYEKDNTATANNTTGVNEKNSSKMNAAAGRELGKALLEVLAAAPAPGSSGPDVADLRQIANRKALQIVRNTDVALDMEVHAGPTLVPASEVGQTPLVMACKKHFEDVALGLIERGANVNIKIKNENCVVTPLQTAVMLGQTSVVRAILASGHVDVDADVFQGRTALQMCCASNDSASIVTMLIQSGANKDVKDRSGKSALQIALGCEHLLIATQLLKIGAAVLPAVKDAIMDRLGREYAPYWTTLEARLGLKVVEDIKSTFRTALKQNKNDNVASVSQPTGAKPMSTSTSSSSTSQVVDSNSIHNVSGDVLVGHLCQSIAQVQEDSVIQILESKSYSTLDAIDDEGCTPLVLCGIRGNLDRIVAALLKEGACVNAADYNGMTALSHACLGGCAKTVNLLLSNGADVNVRDKAGKTALIHLAKRACDDPRRVDILNNLLARGADPDVVDESGESALLVSIFATKIRNATHGDASNDFVLTLLAAGANPHVADAYGHTCLMPSVIESRMDAISQKLLDAGVDPNAANSAGVNVVMNATESDKPDMLLLLLVKYKVNAHAKDKRGKTLLMLCMNKHPSIAIMLIEEIGVDIHAVTEDGQTSLTLACACGREEVAMKLIELGCDVHAKTDVQSSMELAPLMHACLGDLPEVVLALVERGAEVKGEKLKAALEEMAKNLKNRTLKPSKGLSTQGKIVDEKGLRKKIIKLSQQC